MECKVDKGKTHSLTGGKEEFAGMAGEHMQCYKSCADSLIYSMSEILTAKPMQWTCSLCRAKSNSKATDTAADEVCSSSSRCAAEQRASTASTWAMCLANP